MRLGPTPLDLLASTRSAEEAGFEVIKARDAYQSIALLECRSDVRLVLTDIEMPGGMNGMNGMKLAAAVRKRWPPIAIILTTAGHAPAAADIPEQAIFIPKPLNRERTVQTIRLLTEELGAED